MANSKRLITLVGSPYQVMKIMHRQRINNILFNTYPGEAGCKCISCLVALNNCFRQYVTHKVIHSFRYSFRDRLHNAGGQPEIMISFVGGQDNPWDRFIVKFTTIVHCLVVCR